MTLKDQLIQELEGVADPVLGQVLDFLQFLKAKQAPAATPSMPTPPESSGQATEATTPTDASSASSSDALPTVKAIYTDGACSGNPGPGAGARCCISTTARCMS